MAKQRYVIRLHRVIREEFDILARKKGHLTPTFISMAIEEMCARVAVEGYEPHPDSEVFQLKRGKKGKGQTKVNADKQMSVYLSDESYEKVGEIAHRLKAEVDKTIAPSFVIRDMLFHWLESNTQQ